MVRRLSLMPDIKDTITFAKQQRRSIQLSAAFQPLVDFLAQQAKVDGLR